MILYCDASVITGLVLRDKDWEAIARYLGAAEAVRFSDFGRGEVVSAIAQRVRSDRADAAGITRLFGALDGLLDRMAADLILSADIARATELVARVSLVLRLPDAIHIALAERLGATLITTDRQQHAAARSIGLSTINPLIEDEPA